jgi:uncharacterized protein (TIGR03067 family)
MRRTTGGFSIAVAVVVAALGCSTVHKSDTSVLQGTWKGQETGRPAEGTCYLIISGNTLEFRGADSNEWYKGTFTLRESANPKQLVGVISECPAPQYVGKTVYGIYRIEEGTLTLTGNEPGNPELPNRFEAPGSRTFVLKKS